MATHSRVVAANRRPCSGRIGPSSAGWRRERRGRPPEQLIFPRRPTLASRARAYHHVRQHRLGASSGEEHLGDPCSAAWLTAGGCGRSASTSSSARGRSQACWGGGGIDLLRMVPKACRRALRSGVHLRRTLRCGGRADGRGGGSWVILSGAVAVVGREVPERDRNRAYVMDVRSDRSLRRYVCV